MATISSLLADHVSLRVRSVDRILLAGYVPAVAVRRACWCGSSTSGRVGRSRRRRCWGRSAAAYVEDLNAFAKAHEIPVVRFTKDMVKEDVARPQMQEAERDGRSGVVMLGVAQEKAFAWRGWRDGGNDAHPHFEFARQAVFVNHYYHVHLRSAVGTVVHQDQRVRALPGVDLPQRT